MQTAHAFTVDIWCRPTANWAQFLYIPAWADGMQHYVYPLSFLFFFIHLRILCCIKSFPLHYHQNINIFGRKIILAFRLWTSLRQHHFWISVLIGSIWPSNKRVEYCIFIFVAVWRKLVTESNFVGPKCWWGCITWQDF